MPNLLPIVIASTLAVIVGLVALGLFNIRKAILAASQEVDSVLAQVIAAAETEALQRQNSNLQIAWTVLRHLGAEFRIEGDNLYSGDKPLNGDNETIDKIVGLVGGTVTVFMGDLRIATNILGQNGERAIGTRLDPQSAAYDQVLRQGRPYRGKVTILGKPYLAGYDPIKNASGEVIGILYVGIPVTRDVAGEPPLSGLKAGNPFLLGARMERSVKLISDICNEVSTNNEAIESGRRSGVADRLEFEHLQASAADSLAQVIQALSLGLKQLASGNLTQRLQARFAEQYEPLRNDFNMAMGKLEDAMSAVLSTADGIRAGTDEISQGANDLSKRTEQQAASLEETAAALEEITATVRKTAEGAAQAAQVVTKARSEGESSREVVQGAVSAISAIEQSAKQIGQIIGVIDEIAFQTNLLALNAGVEAARAGDAGRGFAVVAQEVRALAQRSAEAAKEIKALISTSSNEVALGVKMVGASGEALDNIVRQVNTIKAVITEIAASAKEQATGLQEVNTAVNQMDQMTQQNAAMVEESTAAIGKLATETSALSDLIENFQVTAVNIRQLKDNNPSRTKIAFSPVRKPVVALIQSDNLAPTNGWEEF